MRFYNVDMKGKNWLQRGAGLPAGTVAADEGRIYYDETGEEVSFRNSTGWNQIISQTNAAALIPGLIGSDFLRKDQADVTLYQLTMAGLVVSGSTGTINGNTIWHAGNDGPGSGLNADLLDNYTAGNASGNIPISNGTINSNLNADLLDGQQGTYYRNATNLNAGTVAIARLSGTYNISITGTARYA